MTPEPMNTPLRDKQMPALLVALAAVVLAGCDSQAVPPSPAAYDQAKDDCAPFGGLASVKHVLVLLRPDRIDAVCAGGGRVSRDAAKGGA